MRLLSCISLAVLATILTVVGAQSSDSSSDLAAVLELYPDCALTCLFKLVPQSGCASDDFDCQCHNDALNANITGCVMQSCSTIEALQTKNASSTVCGVPIRDLSGFQVDLVIIGCGITFVFFLVRMYSNHITYGRDIGADGYTIIAAMVLTIVTTVLGALCGTYGIGKDIWGIKPADIEKAIKYFVFGEIFYFLSVGMTRISILMYMLRVFSGTNFNFKKQVYVLAGLVVAHTLTFSLVTLFQCQPVDYSWKQLDDNMKGKCNDINLQGWTSAIFAIMLDIAIMALPMRPLWRLNMPLGKKLMVMGMFSLGIFIIIVSALRLHVFIAFGHSTNATWGYKDAGNWSMVELFVSVICACLPAFRMLFVVSNRKKQQTATDQKYYVSNGTNGTNRSRSTAGPGALSSRAKSPPTLPEARGDFMRLVDIESGTGAKSDCSASGAEGTIVAKTRITIHDDSTACADDKGRDGRMSRYEYANGW